MGPPPRAAGRSRAVLDPSTAAAAAYTDPAALAALRQRAAHAGRSSRRPLGGDPRAAPAHAAAAQQGEREAGGAPRVGRGPSERAGGGGAGPPRLPSPPP